jgi:hypothetical protein
VAEPLREDNIFRHSKWIFTGASGATHLFSILPKSAEPPDGPGVFILAYVHPRGHLAGWRATPLHIGHAPDMRRALADVALDSDRKPLWNCTFVRPEPLAPARQACARDLALHDGPFETGRHLHHPDATD